MVVKAAVPSSDPGASEASDVAPWSMTRVCNADIDEHAASLREWKQIYEQMTPGPFVGSLREISWRNTQVFRETTSQAVHESGGPRWGKRAFGVPVVAARTGLFRGEPVDLDTIVTLGGDDELDFYTPRGFEILGLVVDCDVLEGHAQGVEHRELDEFIDGTGTLKPGTERVCGLRNLLLSVLQSLNSNPAALQCRQTQRVLEQSLLGAVIAAAPDHGVATTPPHQSRRHLVNAARALMQSRIAEPITVADVCVALGISRRTLQYSFQDVLGINPVRFLRALRLNGVRRDLRNETSRASVQETAARWGFWHLGHFVSDYKRMFGELPSQTLHHDRRRAIAQA